MIRLWEHSEMQAQSVIGTSPLYNRLSSLSPPVFPLSPLLAPYILGISENPWRGALSLFLYPSLSISSALYFYCFFSLINLNKGLMTYCIEASNNSFNEILLKKKKKLTINHFALRHHQ